MKSVDKKIKVILWGYDKSAELKLETLCSMHDVVINGVIVPGNRDASVVRRIKDEASKYNIYIYEPVSLKNNDTFYGILSYLRPDIFIVDSYTKLIPKRFLDIPRIGSFNFHPGKLPEYRGAHVLNWAIINGEGKISLTLHRMDEKFDSGEILFTEEIEITFLDNINTVFEKVCKTGVALMIRLMESIKNNTLKGYPQSEVGAKYYRARRPKDGKIDWHKTNVEIYNLIRALLQPWPCAFFTYNDKRIRIHEAYPVPLSTNVRPASVVAIGEKAFCVATGNNSLLVREADKMDFSIGEKL